MKKKKIKINEETYNEVYDHINCDVIKYCRDSEEDMKFLEAVLKFVKTRYEPK